VFTSTVTIPVAVSTVIPLEVFTVVIFTFPVEVPITTGLPFNLSFESQGVMPPVLPLIAGVVSIYCSYYMCSYRYITCYCTTICGLKPHRFLYVIG
jgi:hypothetical protein